MNLIQNYASVLTGGADPKRTLALMKQKGHLSLLPQVVKVLEREKSEGEVMVVANEKDAKGFKGNVVVDSRIVGGYLKRSGSKIIDATYRKALVEIYKNAVK